MLQFVKKNNRQVFACLVLVMALAAIATLLFRTAYFGKVSRSGFDLVREFWSQEALSEIQSYGNAWLYVFYFLSGVFGTIVPLTGLAMAVFSIVRMFGGDPEEDGSTFGIVTAVILELLLVIQTVSAFLFCNQMNEQIGRDYLKNLGAVGYLTDQYIPLAIVTLVATLIIILSYLLSRPEKN